ncbi:hypothetical protein [Photobacterium satsumensis]|uniref:hypothetical protein n=1 Tax=Photobacterium satsumensis TaxID=2910239 RepID=UPI003D12295B
MSDKQENQNVTVVDIRMPFTSMVTFMVKFAIASIPAVIILSFLFFGLAIFFGVFGALLQP